MKKKHGLFFGFAVLLIAAMFTMAGCGDSGSGDPTGTGEADLTGTITISPSGSVTVGTELTANYSGTETVTYQWKKGNANVGTNSSYTPEQAGSYTVTVRASSFKSKISDPVVVTVFPVITITTQPTNRSVITGNISGNLTVTASVTEGARLTYQWYSNTSNSNTGGTIVSDAIYATFNIPTSLTEGTYYYFCEVRATGAVSVRSNAATITVNPIPQGDVNKISLTGFPLSYTYDYVSIALYSNGTNLTTSEPRYTGFVAKAEGSFRGGGSALDCLLFDPVSSKLINLPAAESYFITIHVSHGSASGWWGSTRKLNIASPIEYTTENLKWRLL